MPRQLDAWLAELTLADLATNTDQICARLRAQAPVAFVPALDSWVATTWQHCEQIAKDATNFAGGTSDGHDRLFGTPNVLGAEGDVHAALRQVIDPPLRPRVFKASLETNVRVTVRAALSDLATHDEPELMAHYFEPVSVRSVADRFGFAHIGTDRLRHWFHSLAYTAATGLADPDAFGPGEAAKAEIRNVIRAMVDTLSADPDDSAISHWLHDGMPAGEIRDIESLFPSLLVILLGGLQEPGHACGSTFLGLMTRPDQLARVLAEPALLPRAITEGMRWMSPLYSGASRVARNDVEVAGAQLRRGDTVWLTYGSANRDETVFAHPDVFDLDRPSHPHLAFGTGRHSCAGAAFAPQIARIALEELFSAYPAVGLDPQRPAAVTGWMFRGAPTLNVVLK